MDKIILKDKTEFEIAERASLGNIQIKAENFDAVKTITDAFTAANLEEVTFTHNDQTSGEYENLKYEGFSYVPNMGEDGTYTVTVNLRTKTEIEKRLDSLEKGHIANATAIDSIITDIIPGMDNTEGVE